MSLTWTATSAPTNAWSTIASNSDGTKLIAAGAGGKIYTSANSGVTWSNSNNSNNSTYLGSTSSADGTKLAACSNTLIFTSADSGANWTQRQGGNWSSITSSSDGTKLASCINGGQIYTSTDSGATWSNSNNSPSLSWNCITSSADGTKLAAGISGAGGVIYTSTDSGTTWSNSNNSTNQNWNGITSSADGTKLAACCNFQKIYTSTDSGVTWSNSNNSPSQRWYGIASSSDGTHLAGVGAVGGDIYISTDSGATWTISSAPSAQDWRAIASNSDGTKLAAVINGGTIYTGSPPPPPPPYPCFKEGSLILTDAGYKPVQDLRTGDLVKTILNDFVPINMIGKSVMEHAASDDRVKDQLYKYTQDNYSEIFEPLVLTGCHSILIDDFDNETQKETVFKVLGDIYVTDRKYRLPACVDPRASVYETPGTYTIYHLALDNDDYYMNYGIYANGLLVESCSKRYLKEHSNMTLI